MDNTSEQDSIPTEQTFISCKNLFDTLSERCMEVADDLNSFIDSNGEPLSKALVKVVDKQQQLAELLGRAAKEGFSTKLDTRLQFSVSRDIHRKPASAEEALQQASRINGDVARELAENGQKLASEDVGETLKALAVEADAINQQISWARITMNDI